MRAEPLAQMQATFDAEGMLILPSFFPAQMIDTVLAVTEQVRRLRPADAVLDDLDTGERTVLALLSPEAAESHWMKLYDLHLGVPHVQALALAAELTALLGALLRQEAVLCHSLYLPMGSAQSLHADTLYMTPRTPGHLIAAWVALEDVHPDAGPLLYMKGSHKLPRYRFSDGTHHEVDGEQTAWKAAAYGAAAAAGLRTETFHGRKGDVLIWAADLLHGGAEIRDRSLTRRSFVFHYFSATDAEAGGSTLRGVEGGKWIQRPPQPITPQAAARLPFNEQRYLARYADVASAVAAGAFPDGHTHFMMFGLKEGRLPG
jgi:ectoine hydroxylase-related dioxygenase (phytanoyl-CoA dioxygenase family)